MQFVFGILFLAGVAAIGYGGSHHLLAMVLGGVIAAVAGFGGLFATDRSHRSS